MFFGEPRNPPPPPPLEPLFFLIVWEVIDLVSLTDCVLWWGDNYKHQKLISSHVK